MMGYLFGLQLLTTHAMVGLIWFVQIVHYPMFALVGNEQFVEYARVHRSRTTAVVAPIMLVELLTAAAWLWHAKGWWMSTCAAIGIGLLAVVWLSTALLQVPRHTALARGFDVSDHRWLVASNWIRTIAWTSRSLVLTYVTVQSMAPLL